jgi:uncharacterized protein (TIGR00369 family)
MSQAESAQAFMPDGEDGQHFESFMAFERTEWREGYVRIRVTLGPQHRNRQGFIHGGVIGALLDSAGMFAGTFDVETGRGKAAVTVSTACQFIGSTKGESVEAIGELTRAGRSLYFSDAKVTDPETGAVLASGQGTYKYR